jgi:hypothetical protein
MIHLHLLFLHLLDLISRRTDQLNGSISVDFFCTLLIVVSFYVLFGGLLWHVLNCCVIHWISLNYGDSLYLR